MQSTGYYNFGQQPYMMPHAQQPSPLTQKTPIPDYRPPQQSPLIPPPLLSSSSSQQQQQQQQQQQGILNNSEEAFDDEDSEEEKKPMRNSGRRKIKIEYIEDKTRRHITFSKRKAGIMKKAYELSTLTGTQVLLLVVSETGLVYTFTTPKLQPLVTKPEGKNLIQTCLNTPDNNNNSMGENNGQQTLGSPSMGNSGSYRDQK